MDRKLQIGDKLYPFPDTGDLNWGQDVYNWAAAITNAVNTGGSGSGGTSFTVGTGLNLTAGVLGISDAGVDTDQLADESVTASKLALSAVTQNKISNGAVIADKIGINAITEEKLDATNTPTNNQILSYAGSNRFTWITSTGGTPGPKGDPGVDGKQGDKGDTGPGVAAGGTAGQLLSKASATDFDTQWVDATSSGVEDLSGVRGGSGISVAHTVDNTIATVSIIPSVQDRLMPNGGEAQQVLTKASGNDYSVFWGDKVPNDYITNSMLKDNILTQEKISVPMQNILLGPRLPELSGTFTELQTVPNPIIIGNTLLQLDGETRIDTRMTINRWDLTEENFGTKLASITITTPPGSTHMDWSHTLTDGTNLYMGAGDMHQVRRGATVTDTIDLKGMYAFNPSTGERNNSEDVVFGDVPDILKEITDVDGVDIFDVLNTFYNPANKTFYYEVHSDSILLKNTVQEPTLEEKDSLITDRIDFLLHNNFYLRQGASVMDYHAYDVYTTQRNPHYDIHLAPTEDVYLQGFQTLIHSVDSFGVAKLGITGDNEQFHIYRPYVPYAPGKGIRLENNTLIAKEYVAGEGLHMKELPNEDLEFSIRASGVTYDRLENAFNWVDNAGSIDKAFGFENIALVYKQQTGIGSNFPEWVPANLDDLFQLDSTQIGLDDNPDRQHNYGLQLKDGAIRQEKVLPIDDLENLVGITFLGNPAVGSIGSEIRHRLAKPWTTESPDFDSFTLATNLIEVIIPAKRDVKTRAVTHLLIRAGRASGISDASDRTDIINATRDIDNINHEILVPIYSSYDETYNATRADAVRNYHILFASGISAGIRVVNFVSNGNTIFEVVTNNQTPGYNGTEFLSFHAVRGIGG